jgi:hypothetical protein
MWCGKKYKKAKVSALAFLILNEVLKGELT